MPAAPISISAELDLRREAIHRDRQERAIEDLLFCYPRLIDPSLRLPKRQVVLSKDSRADLLFETARGIVLVEIKRDIIRPSTVEQIERYAMRMGAKPTRVRGFLIAPEISPAAEKRLKNSSLRLIFKALGRDIPIKVKICRRCRNPYDARLAVCPDDRIGEVL